ncbi:VPLPA-CTERM sorting domain-containing protein [uncultured Jannaschia sp.]|uniref:VPLPA-CTERM sorting domain-containing protein n=1 Tax=uncultured Jannaschia sp. TaxID=293347 RepID=UPI00261B2980|nr:VPLPA-CTERM sorting domain-containing protein [uncultured Jannaschia sp.]
MRLPVIALISSLVAALPAAAATITNGSFAHGLDGWTVTGDARIAGEYGIAEDGGAVLQLPKGSTISQIVDDFIAGHEYRFAFSSFGDTDDSVSFKVRGKLEDVRLYVGGSSVDWDGGALPWQTKFIDFVADSTSQELLFTAHNFTSAPLIGNISLTDLTPAPDVAPVPLPAAGLLLLAGLGGFGVMGRMRAKAAI